MIALYLLYGVALLLPWNIYLKAIPYFQSALPSYSTTLSGMAAFSFQGSNLVALVLIILFPIQRRSLKWSVLGALFLQSLFVILAYLVKYLPYLSYFLFIIISSGLTTAVLQASLYTLLLPHVNAAPWFQAGQALAGLVVSAGTIFLVPNKNNDMLGVQLYFSLTFLLLLITLVSSAVFEKGWDSSSDAIRSKPTSIDKSLLSSYWPISLSMACCLAFTLFLFPSLFFFATSSKGNELFRPLTFVIYDTGDLIGKLLPTVYCVINKNAITLFPYLRPLLFIPMIITNLQGSPIQSDWFYYLLVALFAVTNGYFLTILITSVSKSTKDEESASSLGLLVSMSICVGAAVGSGMSVALPWIIQKIYA